MMEPKTGHSAVHSGLLTILSMNSVRRCCSDRSGPWRAMTALRAPPDAPWGCGGAGGGAEKRVGWSRAQPHKCLPTSRPQHLAPRTASGVCSVHWAQKARAECARASGAPNHCHDMKQLWLRVQCPVFFSCDSGA